MSVRKFKIWGHRRSGNNFLKECFRLNFDGKVTNVHWPFDDHIAALIKETSSVFMIRDGRDVMVSSYYWWKLQRGTGPYFMNRSFQDFIYGRIQIPPSDWMYNGGQQDYKRHKPEPEMYTDPIGYWANYIDSWCGQLPTIKFEDLKDGQQAQITRCSSELGAPTKNSEIHTVNKLVGHAPRRGIKGDWKNHFTKEDEKYFWQKAGEAMEKYGYKR